MAALPYMQLYITDYLADTAHLTTEEHGAYLLLLFNYWQTGKPLPINRLARISRLSNERWTDVEQVLNEYFTIVENCWVHKRIEKDLDRVKGVQESKSAAGKASAEAKKKAQKTAKPPTPVEHTLNTTSTNKDTYTDNIKDNTSIALPDWMPVSDWEDFLSMRKAKKKYPTERAKELLIMELGKLKDKGGDVSLILQRSIKNSWIDVYELPAEKNNNPEPQNNRKYVNVL